MKKFHNKYSPFKFYSILYCSLKMSQNVSFCGTGFRYGFVRCDFGAFVLGCGNRLWQRKLRRCRQKRQCRQETGKVVVAIFAFVAITAKNVSVKNIDIYYYRSITISDTNISLQWKGFCSYFFGDKSRSFSCFLRKEQLYENERIHRKTC